MALVGRRLSHEPTAYLTGHKEFFGLEFEVTPAVLIPRPETETLVEKAVELATALCPGPCSIADVGTGCGAIAISLAVNLPNASIYATDVSRAALQVGRVNSQRHGVSGRITLLQGDLVDPLPAPVDLMVANLPYVRDSELADLAPEITDFEPTLALAGGIDGLRRIEEFISQARRKLLPTGAVLLEIGHDQGQSVCEIARRYFPTSTVSITSDLSGLDRVVSILQGDQPERTSRKVRAW